MSVIMTAAGEALMARLQAAGLPLVIDTFLFAHVPDLDPDAAVSPASGVPTEHVVLEYPIPVEYRAFINPNQVVYSALLGSDMGDFSFNWQGLVCSEHDTLIAVATFPTLEKRKYDAASGGVGNNLTRNFMLEFSGARELTGITVSADVWQLDFTVRLAGMDERERLSNRDLYGPGCFLGEGWLLERTETGYVFRPGMGYVGGIRAVLTEPLPAVPLSLPCDVWLSACLRPQGSDRVAEASPMLLAAGTPVTDGADETGLMHYRVWVASVDGEGTVTDRRVVWKPRGTDGMLADLVAMNNSLLASLAVRRLYAANIWK